ncbi:MAG TPA: NAD(P)/FAD-dependent oxidoreductase [Acidimicrobiales bacterium]|nr:NAD(P)/FAD-dependent oxidoreductase [Acidimicrobiales bacterium]
MTTEHFDVLIVGAGLSGVGAGYRLQTSCPDRTWAILEARQSMGGTWDLFRYPGIRSDSDMFTLGFQFRPWAKARAIADGTSIRHYIEETAAEFGIDRKVRYGQKVTAAAWDSEAARWTVEVNGGERAYTCGFLYMCSGYYSYDEGYAPVFPGQERFAGPVIHPQFWPEDLDYAGKRVVVVGSGATAITLVPAMAETAGHITMLQRSPTYIASLPGVDPLAALFNRYLPGRVAHQANRLKSIVLTQFFYQFCQRFPALARRLLAKWTAEQLPDGYPIDPNFTPRYNPWDQRMCMVPDGDLFQAIKDGRASVVTGTIDTFTKTGIRLTSGEEVPADIIITATGLQLQLGGGANMTVDGTPVVPGDTFVYRGCMLSGVPNFAMCVGYTNASWTLRADLSSKYVCRVLNHMKAHGYRSAVPEHVGDGAARPLLDLSSGYVQRAVSILPKQGDRPPWMIRQNYILDYFTANYADITEQMRFSGVGEPAGGDGSPVPAGAAAG